MFDETDKINKNILLDMVILFTISFVLGSLPYIIYDYSFPVGCDTVLYVKYLFGLKRYGLKYLFSNAPPGLTEAEPRETYILYNLLGFSVHLISGMSFFEVEKFLPIFLSSVEVVFLYSIMFQFRYNRFSAVTCGYLSIFWYGRLRMARDLHGNLLAFTLTLFSILILMFFLKKHNENDQINAKLLNTREAWLFSISLFLSALSHGLYYFLVVMLFFLATFSIFFQIKFKLGDICKAKFKAFWLFFSTSLSILFFIVYYLLTRNLFPKSPPSINLGHVSYPEVPPEKPPIGFYLTFGSSYQIDGIGLFLFLLAIGGFLILTYEAVKVKGYSFLSRVFAVWFSSYFSLSLIFPYLVGSMEIPFMGFQNIEAYRFLIMIPTPIYVSIGLQAVLDKMVSFSNVNGKNLLKNLKLNWILALVLLSMPILSTTIYSTYYVIQSPVYYDFQLMSELVQLKNRTDINNKVPIFVIRGLPPTSSRLLTEAMIETIFGNRFLIYYGYLTFFVQNQSTPLYSAEDNLTSRILWEDFENGLKNYGGYDNTETFILSSLYTLSPFELGMVTRLSDGLYQLTEKWLLFPFFIEAENDWIEGEGFYIVERDWATNGRVLESYDPNGTKPFRVIYQIYLFSFMKYNLTIRYYDWSQTYPPIFVKINNETIGAVNYEGSSCPRNYTMSISNFDTGFYFIEISTYGPHYIDLDWIYLVGYN